MRLDPIELGRLAKLQKYPLEYIERRVENVDLKDDHHYAVNVTQQLEIPSHGTEPQAARNLLIPVGYFGKSLLPDLRVARESGAELPVANRADRGRITAIIVGSPWEHLFFDEADDDQRGDVERLWTWVQVLLGIISTEQPTQAQEAYDDLRDLVHEWCESQALPEKLRAAAKALEESSDFWATVRATIDTRLRAHD
jgi:hypothetical protein